MPRPQKTKSVEIVKTTKPGFRFMVDLYDPEGKRQRKYFATRLEAEQLRVLKLRAWSDPEYNVEYSKAEREAVATARRAGLDLAGIVADAVARAVAEAKAAPDTVSTLCTEWLESLKKAGRSDGHLRTIQRVIGRAAAMWGGVRVCDVTPAMIGTAMRANPRASASTQASYRRILHGFFGHAVDSEIRPDNPVAKVKSPRSPTHADDTIILTPHQSRDLLAAVQEHAPILMPAVAIGMFAGLRSGEIQRLTWEDVKLDRGLIVVTSGKSKTGNRRMVSVLPCLHALLAPHQPGNRKEDVWPANGMRLWDRCIKAAGWRGHACWAPVARKEKPPWPQNALRHSFVSYHVAAMQDAARTALEAGHSQEILFKHYRQLATEDEAAEFWTAGFLGD